MILLVRTAQQVIISGRASRYGTAAQTARRLGGHSDFDRHLHRLAARPEVLAVRACEWRVAGER